MKHLPDVMIMVINDDYMVLSHFNLNLIPFLNVHNCTPFQHLFNIKLIVFSYFFLPKLYVL